MSIILIDTVNNGFDTKHHRYTFTVEMNVGMKFVGDIGHMEDEGAL